MKKLASFLCLALACIFLTACGETPYNFTLKASDTEIYETFMGLSTKQNSFISNVEDNLQGSMATADKNVLTNSLDDFKELNDLILLVMPIFDLGESGPETSAVYSTSNFNNTTYRNIEIFQVERIAVSAQAEESVLNYRMDWSAGGIVIDYTLKVAFNDSLNQNEYTINMNFQDSNTAVNSFTKTYLIRYEKASSYFYFELKDTPTSLNALEAEYYILSDDYYIARIRECTYVNSVPNYTGTDIMFNNYNGRVKYGEYSTQKPASIKGLTDITYSSFALLSDSDRASTLSRYSFEITDGRVNVNKVTRGN